MATANAMVSDMSIITALNLDLAGRMDRRLDRTNLEHNPTQSKTYYQLKLDYLRRFGVHDVSGLILFNRSTRTYDNLFYRFSATTTFF